MITNKILKTELIEWRNLEWLQGDLKDISKESLDKLKLSIKQNDFIQPFNVWEDGKSWILDGHHRLKALKELETEGIEIPLLLPANIIDCKNKKEATKLVLIYSSIYASVSHQGLTDFMFENDLKLDDLQEIDLPNIDLDVLDKTDGKTEAHLKLQDKFIVPPFSILDTRQGYWQDRKRYWKELIGDNGESRENSLGVSKESEGDWGSINGKKMTVAPNVSILDPVLAEIVNRWFGSDNCKTFDCFAGDSVFGYVSDYLGNTFTGIELRKEQTDLNNKRLSGTNSKYICDDGQNVLKHIGENSQDLLFSCPPYFDLEVYSNLDNDASNQKEYSSFIKILDNAFSDAIKCLKNNRFAVIAVGDIRDKQGFYYRFVGHIKDIFEANGTNLYNELILVEQSGTAAMRAERIMGNRKVVKTHQNILVFYKGNPKEIKNIFPKLDFTDMEQNESPNI